jgi:hypothetical protein
LSTVSIIPGIETRAPERTETSSGRSASPKRCPIICSTLASAVSTSALMPGVSRPPFSLYSAQTPVEIVKPAGTGTPRLVISARLAPLPPRISRISALPSARPLPKE